MEQIPVPSVYLTPLPLRFEGICAPDLNLDLGIETWKLKLKLEASD